MTIETIDQQGDGYAGNVTPETAWSVLQDDPHAQLIDVRTAAEWAYVGLPDLSPLGKEVLRVEWQTYPSMQVDGKFVERVNAALGNAGAEPQCPVFFICRSGARSARAAQAATAAGWSRAFNVATGFEGDPDGERHRGRVNGWKVAGLPWVQS
jgi:rhodanese-related sulfurtransferase